MDDQYKAYYKRATDLKYRLEDVVDDHNHPQIQQLKREVHGLVDDFEMQKDPRHTENRLKTIEHELMQTRNHGESLMSFREIDSLQHEVRDLRAHVRTHPNY
ncbi:MAG TPA: hypothetical protein VF572_05285 [Candidatus Saccharimonadales bacterium]|jgi:uncharacterized Ntn-hydrolase superfamily protein